MSFAVQTQSRSDCPVAGLRLPIVTASLVEHRVQSTGALVVVVPGLWSVGSVVVAHGLSCPIACESSQIRNQTLSPELAGGFFTSEPPRKPPG